MIGTSVRCLPAAVLLAATLAAAPGGGSARAQAVPEVIQPAQPAAADPWESVNRAVHGFNMLLTDWVAGPAASAYEQTVPTAVQAGVGNLFANLREPATAVSSLLQGDLANARTSAGRFAINSTAGIGGLYDVATGMGWVARREDAGTFLCHYGAPSGPYVVLPFLGPSTLRDAIGLAAVYGLGYGLLGDDLAPVYPAYVIADRAVSMLRRKTEAPADDHYQEQRKSYLRQRDSLCGEKAAPGPAAARPTPTPLPPERPAAMPSQPI
ncbi:VacJ family lipoprotein [Azospirillum sp. SYSU D00513]|uniref:MlaA family lipoprotein n=1 Tax=Azospirillum sp. SYSU D00513 TaxID=2812561 RepID=UPI001A95FF8E|nr:VacJ family lipoprotein [Azospirillum sp. SYSU D00513]